MANETALGLAWIISELEADAPLAGFAPGGVHRGTAPLGTPTPYISVGQQAGSDTTTANRIRLFSGILYQVKACGPTSGPDADAQAVFAAAGRIDELIDNKRNQAVDGGVILSSSREEPLAYDEDEPDGTKFSHVGGLYALQIQKL